ncbi:MAG: hypothetical protein II670_09505 [Alphaproteobacteria bacterium]|nr:hypothetical protein [Alphaproteobacteria bacterium]
MRLDSIENITVWRVLKVALPLMISALSSHFMLILDQLVLARYSIDAMIGASSASSWCVALQFAIMSTTIIAGSFVGNYNGAGKYEQAGIPVWQMIWFSLSLFMVSVPLSLFASALCIPENLRVEGVPYFRVLMCAAPIYGVCSSLSSFFASIGKGYLITISVILANVVNILVDIVLVFGYFGIDCYKGSVGAAIGTVMAVSVNTVILFACFIHPHIRNKYKTFNFRLQIDKLKEYLKLGLAGGISHMFETSSWAVLYYLLAKVAKEEAMLQSIAVSVNLFMAFIVCGLEKGAMAITSNLLGANKREKIGKVLEKSSYIHLAFIMVIAVIFKFYPELIINNFIRFDISPEIFQRASDILWLVLLYFLIDGFVWIIAGIVEAGGDINYMMITIASCLWSVVAIPDYFLYKSHLLHVERTWMLLFVSVVTSATLLYHRYKSNKWIHIKV